MSRTSYLIGKIFITENYNVEIFERWTIIYMVSWLTLTKKILNGLYHWSLCNENEFPVTGNKHSKLTLGIIFVASLEPKFSRWKTKFAEMTVSLSWF